jgi:hypothetical protein
MRMRPVRNLSCNKCLWVVSSTIFVALAVSVWDVNHNLDYVRTKGKEHAHYLIDEGLFTERRDAAPGERSLGAARLENADDDANVGDYETSSQVLNDKRLDTEHTDVAAGETRLGSEGLVTTLDETNVDDDSGAKTEPNFHTVFSTGCNSYQDCKFQKLMDELRPSWLTLFLFHRAILRLFLSSLEVGTVGPCDTCGLRLQRRG